MRRSSVLALLAVVSGFGLVAACVGDDSSTPFDGGGDATTDVGADVGSDAGSGDAAADVTADADAGPRSIVQIVGGGDFGCVLVSDGTVWCWGGNRVGQLGLGGNLFDNLPHPTPAQVVGVSNVTAISAGSWSVCAIEVDRSVWCWGQNTYDELGHDNSTDLACGGNVACDPTPTKVPTVAAAQVSQGLGETCVVNPTGAVRCWGLDDSGQLGDGLTPTSTPTPTPVSVTGLPTVMKTVSVGTTLTGNVCGIDSSGNLWCWGDNSWGQLGHTPGAAGDQAGAPCHGAYCNSTPRKVTLDPDAGTTLANVADVRAGWATCVVRTDGTVWCWGNDQTGELGQGTHDKQIHETPTPIASLGTDGERIVGGDALCLLGKSGAVSCWGEAAWDVPGVGESIGCTAFAGNPSPCVPAPAAVGSLTAAGLDTSQARHAVALLVDGGVVGWGSSAGGANGHAPGLDGDIEAGALWLNPTPSPITLPF